MNIIKFYTNFALVIFLVGILSCKLEPNLPSNVQIALSDSGQNRDELLKVIQHYRSPEDSLKLAAAYFLISNLKDRYFYEGELVEQYSDYYKLIRGNDKQGDLYLDQFYENFGPFHLTETEKHKDLHAIKASDLITNIEVAFKSWQEQPWGKDLTFDMFCKYVLPFKINDEKPTHNRSRIYERYKKILDSRKYSALDAIAACQLINDNLKSPQWIMTNKVSFLPTTGPDKLLKYRVGTCKNMTDLGIYVMRACGIPVTSDFVPYWPYRNGGHDWNVVFDKNRIAHSFLGAEDSPNTPHKPFTKKGKVYRRMFTINHESLAAQRSSNDEIPRFLQDARIWDVTEEYAITHQIDLIINNSQHNQKYAYLCVFNNQAWSPVAWSKIGSNGETSFAKVEGGIVYVLGYFINSKIVPATMPFLLNTRGDVRMFAPSSNKVAINVDRIYPVVPEAYWVHDLVGGVFEGANKQDFSDAFVLSKIDIKPLPYWNSKKLNAAKKIRYVRYLSHREQHCFMGEVEFYAGGKKQIGKIITSPGLSKDEIKRPYQNAFDGDTTTFFDARRRERIWFGFDFDKQIEIDSLRFSPALNDVGRLKPSHQYEIFYWDGKGSWVSKGTKFASNQTIRFAGLPENTLYLLEDRTKKSSARIFTFINGVIEWW